ncbi:MAG TPA: penicillin-binding protein 2 [Actinomycetota bacterium]|nr:penicillin-binding protein 2 [Actinomycetota bacterium]
MVRDGNGNSGKRWPGKRGAKKSPVTAGSVNAGLDRMVLRLAVFTLVIVAAFIALFSRLWFLQVLSADDFRALAKENRVRFTYSEPPRGRILDRNGVVLVSSRKSLAVTVDRAVFQLPSEEDIVIARLSDLLDIPIFELQEELNDATVSPYKPVAVAYDVPELKTIYIRENQEDFPGVDAERLPVRVYPEGPVAAHILGYVGEISEIELESDFFLGVRPAYEPGDIVGKLGIERTYDRYLRGRPQIEKVVVNSSNDLVGPPILKQEQQPGRDVQLSIDIKIQRIVEEALENGVRAAQGAGFQAPAGAAVVLHPSTGEVLAMASWPTYDPTVLADGLSIKENRALGASTINDPDDDAFLNRAIQAQRQPASTYKVVTAGAAMATGVADYTTTLDCPGSAVYPPEGMPGAVTFRNWTSLDLGFMGFAESLEQSCDTFYYELGWRMEDAFGPEANNFTDGDGTERFQDYARTAGMGHTTGIDLPYEASGRVPDEEWCKEEYEATKHLEGPTCALGWLPGYTVNMSIGQGDVITTPLQMAVTYAAIANEGSVMVPRVAWRLENITPEGKREIVREYSPKSAARLPLEPSEIEVIQDGLELVVGGVNGTGRPAFAGFPLNEFRVAGKTGTSELGETDLQDAWFVSYGPTESPEYTVAVYLEKAGHGGESAAPIARQIFEAIFGLDESLSVQLSHDESG